MDKNVQEAIKTIMEWASEGEPYAPPEDELYGGAQFREGEKPHADEVRELCRALLTAARCNGMGGCRLCSN